MNIVVLVSGGGTNLQALIDAEKRGEIPGGKISCVIASKPGVYALERAANAGIPSRVVERKAYPDRQSYSKAILDALNEEKADLVILAGFMVILDEQVPKAYPNRILNVHPALIPSFCGPGFYGMKVHEAVLASGVKLTGATVHFVSEVCDGGPSFCRAPCRSSTTIPRRSCKSGSWSRWSGSCFPKQPPCSVRGKSKWKTELQK